jgi:dolichol-phosphate mannosyltransferase
MDSDLQDPPEIIPEMIDSWTEGNMIVYAKRKSREVDSFFKQQTALLFYKFLDFLSDSRVPQNVGDFRLIDKKVVKFLLTLPEHSPFLRGLVAWSGYPESHVKAI